MSFIHSYHGTMDKHSSEIHEKVDLYTKNNLEKFKLLSAFSHLKLKEGTITQLIDTHFKDAKMRQTIMKAGTVSAQRSERQQTVQQSIKKTNDHYGFSIDKEGQVYVRQGYIGKGIFKTVSNAIRLNDLQEFASVSIKGKTINDTEADMEVLKEQTMLKNLSEIEHIVPPMLFTVKTASKIGASKYIMLQKKMNGDGNKLLDESVSARDKLKAIRQAASGLAGMHERGIIHSDFKLPNMLIDEKKNGYVSDFGLSAMEGGRLVGGSMPYLPPEVKTQVDANNCNINASNKMDSYALGICLLQLAAPSFWAQGNIREGEVKNGKFISDLPQEELATKLEKVSKEIKNSGLDRETKETKLGMIKIAAHLLKQDPDERLDCRKAAYHLKRLEEFVSQ